MVTAPSRRQGQGAGVGPEARGHAVTTPTSYDLRVVSVVQETANACSVSLAVPAGAEEEFQYRPGQFLTLAVPSDRTGVAARCYSLSSSPYDGGPLTVTVKRTAGGFASNWICDNLREGSMIRVLKPSGIFTPTCLDANLLLLAGGSGITPVMSITRAALAHGSGQVVLIYANRDEASVIFASELARLARKHPDRLMVVHWLESVQGLPTQDQLIRLIHPFSGHDAFVCGPAPFMDLAAAVLRELGVPRQRLHREKFVSLGGNPFGVPAQPVELGEEHSQAADPAQTGALADPPDDAAPEPGSPVGSIHLEVTIGGEKFVYDDWGPSTKMLEHLESKGLKPPFSCREGECSSCAVRLLEGDVTMLNNDVLDDEDLADGIRLACQSLPLTNVVRVTY